MIDLLAIAVRLRDEAEENALWWMRRGNQSIRRTWDGETLRCNRDIATLDGIARAVTEAGEK